jgi:maltoporin
MRKYTVYTLAGAVLTGIMMQAQAVDFNGYMRAGVGQNIEGGSATSYGNGGSGHRAGRLGDETDTFVEVAFSEEVYNEDDKSFMIKTLFGWGTDEGDIDKQGNAWQGVGGNGPWGEQRTSIREVYAKGDFGDYSLWAGKRYHQRRDIHIMDFYYINNSGYGAGIEDVETDYGTINIAWIQNAEDWQDNYAGGPQGDDWRRQNKLDMRLLGTKVSEKGTLDFALIYGAATLSDGQQANLANEDASDSDGFFATIEHTQGGLIGGGFNKAVVQYGSGGYATIGAFVNHAGEVMDAVDGDGWRLIDWGVLKAGSWNFGWSAMYAKRDITEVVPDTFDDDDNKLGGNSFLDGENDFWNVVVRPSFEWNDLMSTVLELGHSNNKAEGGDWEDLSKITLAQQWQAGSGFWSRPALRFYVSHVAGDVVDARNAQGDDQETMVGAQVEAWW